MSGVTYYRYTYQQIDTLIDYLLVHIRNSGKLWESVVGIADGGLYISQKIASALKLPHHAVRISWYNGEHKRERPLVYDNPELSVYDGPRLIVDDLIDGGGTIASFKNKFGFNMNDDDVAVLFYNTETICQVPSYYARPKPNGWVVFPWEEK